MKFFRMRLILALVVGITLVSVASTYLEVLAHKHVLRQELQRKTAWQSKSLQAAMEKSLAAGEVAGTVAEAVRLRAQNEALGVAVYDLQGRLVTAAGPAGIFAALHAARWTKPSSKAPIHPSLGIGTISNGWKR